MSRFYKIVVGPSPNSDNPGFTWTNRIFGQSDLGAQTVELDIWQSGEDEPVGSGAVKIWGPTKEQLLQASDFNGASIEIYVGMQQGLPFATASVEDGQQGLVSSGIIYQAFGNWQGLNQTLDFIVTPTDNDTQSNPANISMVWKKGTPLADTLRSVITTAYPDFKAPDIQISSDLVLAQDEPFQYDTMTQFAQYIRKVTKNIIGGGYGGVIIVQEGNQWVAFDGTQPVKTLTISIKSQDLIGQPTWLSPDTMQFTTVMRADMRVGSAITFPAQAAINAITTDRSQSFVRDKNTFSGIWQISSIRHVGNSRSPSSNSWVSTFTANANTA